jgi:hypothetical protein
VQQPLGRAERPQDAVADEAAAFLAAALRGESAPATGPQPDLVASPAPEIELLPETSDDENPFEELPPAPDVATHAADDEFLPETRAYRLFDDESVDSVPEVDVFSPAGTGIAEYVVGQPRESAMPVPGAAGLGLENRFAIRSGPPAGSQPQSDAAATREKVDRLQKWLSAIRHADE